MSDNIEAVAEECLDTLSDLFGDVATDVVETEVHCVSDVVEGESFASGVLTVPFGDYTLHAKLVVRFCHNSNDEQLNGGGVADDASLHGVKHGR